MLIRKSKFIAWQLFAVGLWLLSSLHGECFWNAEPRGLTAVKPAELRCLNSSSVPRGEAIHPVGPVAKANPLRFSNKYANDQTDLLYYGYRYYNPSAGRWLSRDPIGEDGGKHLYAVWRNDFVNKFDLFGLCPCSLSAPGSGPGSAAAACQAAIDAVKKNGGPRDIPDKAGCPDCQKTVDNLLANPNFILKPILAKFNKKCPRPPVVCRNCSGKGGSYDGTEIVICVKQGMGVGDYEYSQTLAHELTHALQRCSSTPQNCKDLLKAEMEAYTCGHDGPPTFDNMYPRAIGSSCGVDPTPCSPSEVQKLYDEMQEWYNKAKDGFLCQ